MDSKRTPALYCLWPGIIFILAQFSFSSAQRFSVNLSSYSYLTEDFPIWEKDNSISIPIFFQELEFECISTFPTKWILSKNPLEDGRLKGIPEIFKTRRTNEPDGEVGYTSKILFRFKDPRAIQPFACTSTEDSDQNGVQTILVETSVKSPTILTTNFVRNKGITTTSNLYGVSTDCDLVLEVDFMRRAFACSYRGTRNLVPLLVLCQNSDECGAAAFTGKLTCPDAVKLECLSGCSQFKPRKEPGIIVCGTGNGADGTNSIALKYIVLGVEGSNSTKLVTYDEALARASDFIHIVNTNYVVFEMEEVNFICKASKYVFSQGFRWMTTTTKGITNVLDEGNQTLLEKDGMYIINKTIKFSKAEYGNVSKLSCVGALWNSRNSAKADCDITLKVPSRPRIQEDNVTINIKSGSVTLNCTFNGEPRPQVKWMLWQRTVTMDEEFFKILHRNNSSGFTISRIENLASQNRRLFRITCRVENFFGIDERLFIVSSSDFQSGAANRILIISVVCLIALILMLLLGMYLYLRWVRKQNLEYVKKDIKLFFEGDQDQAQDDAETDPSSSAQRKAYNKDMEIALENIQIEKGAPLGSGAYGMVFRGTAVGGMCTVKTNVAIKTLKPNVDPAYFKALLTELKVILFVGEHENIVNLLGACTERIYEMQLFIILELCSNGELEKYLKTHRSGIVWSHHQCGMYYQYLEERKNGETICYHNLIDWSYEIAHGMNYLASRKVVHADLATRNVLLTDGLTAKLCDFGLSRRLYNYSQYVKKQQAPLPWRWMAIESLRDLEFSTQSDVWSYGVTLWEIFSIAEVPYPGQSWTAEFLQSLLDGLRLKKPVNCSEEIFVIMKLCWEANPKDRPTFLALQNAFRKFMDI